MAGERELTAAEAVHLDQHLTDGLWHDDCPYCHQRRLHAGTGVAWYDQMRDARKLRTAREIAEHLPVINDPVISEAMASLEGQ